MIQSLISSPLLLSEQYSIDGSLVPQELTEQFLAGDHGVWNQITGTPHLTRKLVATRKVDYANADDVAQTTWKRVYRTLPRLRDGGKVTPWIMTIGVHYSIDTARRQRAKPEIPFSAMEPEVLEFRDENQAAELQNAELRGKINEAFDALPVIYSDACRMCFLDRLSYDEIAERLKNLNWSGKGTYFYGKKSITKLFKRYVGKC